MADTLVKGKTAQQVRNQCRKAWRFESSQGHHLSERTQMAIFFTILICFVATAILVLSFIVHLKEQKEYQVKLAVFHRHGGRPYDLNRAHAYKATAVQKAAWAEQDEVNRQAREIAGIGEYA